MQQNAATPPVPLESLPLRRQPETDAFCRMAKCLVPLSGLLSLAGGIFLALAYRRQFDAAIGHIARGSLWFILSLVCFAPAVLCDLYMAVRARRRVRLYRLPPLSLFGTFAAFLAGGLWAAYLLRALGTLSRAGTLTLTAHLTLWLAVVFLLLAGLGRGVPPVPRAAKASEEDGAADAAPEKTKKPGAAPLAVLCAIGGAIAAMLMLFSRYFDFSLPLNSPVRNTQTLLYAGLILFFLAEARMRTDLWFLSGPALFAGLGLAAVALIGLGAAETITAAGGAIDAFSLTEGCALLACGLYALSRLFASVSFLGAYLPPPPSPDDRKKEERRTRQNG